MFKQQEAILLEIKENLKKKQHDKKNILKTLRFLIEESDYKEIREDALKLMNNLTKRHSYLFKILEKCLLSDESPSIRALSARTLMLDYPKACKKSIKWALLHETSPIVLKTIQDLSFGVDGHKLEFLEE